MSKSFFKKVIVAVNGNQASIHTAMYAIMMARTYNITLKFVYVIDTATIKYLSMNKFIIAEEKNEFEEQLKIDGENCINYVVHLAKSKGVNPEQEVRCGGIFTEIIKAAEEFDADLILFGGNEKEVGKTGIKHCVLTRDQNEVLANSKCPVMIVQKPGIEEQFKIF